MQQQNYWFKRKTYGWGWTPANAAGWSVLIGFIFALTLPVFFAPEWIATHIPFYILYSFVLAGVQFWICWIKGEKPGWQWGNKS